MGMPARRKDDNDQLLRDTALIHLCECVAPGREGETRRSRIVRKETVHSYNVGMRK